MWHLWFLTVLPEQNRNAAGLKCKQRLFVFSDGVVEGLCHTWALVPHEQSGTSGVKAELKAQRTRRKADHTCALAAASESHFRSLNTKMTSLAVTVWWGGFSLPLYQTTDQDSELFFFFNDLIRTKKSVQVTTQTALFRGGERVRAALHYSCSLSKIVWERKCCLWFKARANRMGDRALCLLSAIRLECKAVAMKRASKESFHSAAWILMFIWNMSGLHSSKWINCIRPFHSAETFRPKSHSRGPASWSIFVIVTYWSHHICVCHVAVGSPAVSSEVYFL